MSDQTGDGAPSTDHRTTVGYGVFVIFLGWFAFAYCAWQFAGLVVEDHPFVWSALVVYGAALLPGILLVAGLTLGAWAARLRVAEVYLLWFYFDSASGYLSWHVSQVRAMFGLPYSTISTRARSPEALGRRLATEVLVGVFALLLGAVVGLCLSLCGRPAGSSVPPSLVGKWYQAWLRPHDSWRAACNVAGVVGLYKFIQAVLPDGTGQPSWWQHVLECLRGRSNSLRHHAALALSDAMKGGVRPRDCDAAWLALLAGETDGSIEQGLADLAAYYHAEDCGRHDEAIAALDRAATAWEAMDEKLREILCLESAYVQGYHRGDTVQVKHCLDRLEPGAVPAQQWLRVQAALAGAEGRDAEALTLLAAAVEAVTKLPDHGASVAERDWLARMRRTFEERLRAGG